MKTIFLLLMCASLTLATQAQTSDAEAKAMANLLGVQKREALAHLITVTGKDSVAFWKLYDEYEAHNLELSKSRIQLYEQTARSYGSMNNAVADSLSQKFFTNRIAQENSLQAYYKKIKTATNAVVAFEFYQAEVYLLTQIRAAIMQQIPTYGEFVKSIKRP
jgi:hypothetical protein